LQIIAEQRDRIVAGGLEERDAVVLVGDRCDATDIAAHRN
jgi:hypothetical protein